MIPLLHKKKKTSIKQKRKFRKHKRQMVIRPIRMNRILFPTTKTTTKVKTHSQFCQTLPTTTVNARPSCHLCRTLNTPTQMTTQVKNPVQISQTITTTQTI